LIPAQNETLRSLNTLQVERSPSDERRRLVTRGNHTPFLRIALEN